MRNKTSVNVPKKYQFMIDEVYHDSDGYWAYTNKGFRFNDTECHTAHGDTQSQLLQDIRSLGKCECDECTDGSNNWSAINGWSVYRNPEHGKMVAYYRGEEQIIFDDDKAYGDWYQAEEKERWQ